MIPENNKYLAFIYKLNDSIKNIHFCFYCKIIIIIDEFVDCKAPGGVAI